MFAMPRPLLFAPPPFHESRRGIANIDTQGNVHPDQFWQDIVLGNVKQQPFSQIWEGQNANSAETLRSIRSIGTLSQSERQSRMVGPCASCRWFGICGGGFRTRAAYSEKGGLWGSDPGCYLSDSERKMVGLCASCHWFSICGGDFRTRAAYSENGGLCGSDPSCYLSESERSGLELATN